MTPKYKVGDIIRYNIDGSLYKVISGNGLMFYGLKYLSFETHGNCVLRIGGTMIEYVDANFQPITPLEKLI